MVTVCAGISGNCFYYEHQNNKHYATCRTHQCLEKKLLATGFCREGWMETERHIQPPNASIRGECNETATDKDYKNFPNTSDNTD